jgi:excisionase family DNA binding protein
MEHVQYLGISAQPANVHRLLGPADVAKWLGVSSDWVRDHATRKHPRLKAVKLGRMYRVLRSSLQRWIEVCERGRDAA